MTQPWETLFSKAMTLLDYAGSQSGNNLFWTMGGGTVLMLRHHHRSSRDIDIFFSDPQPLGFVNPRLGGAAEEMASKYEESSGHVKLYFPEGEIDFVASRGTGVMRPRLETFSICAWSFKDHPMRYETRARDS